MKINVYERSLSDKDVAEDQHRDYVGGLWDELGPLQLRFMIERAGLRPDMRLLDLGCGCFRGGIHLIPYLQPGYYYGLDVNASLIEAGHNVELPRAGLSLPRDRIRVTDDFNARPFGVEFDRILAVSLWTHLPLNHIQRCLWEVDQLLATRGAFYASFFHCPIDHDLLTPYNHPVGNIVSYRNHDPYHYRLEDFQFLVDQLGLSLRLEWIGDWGHPRHQQMVAFHRVE